ncbi:tetratricopeptide repeat protein [bacterium]|nr:tetratricopeptide repeat protein [bacterium]MBP9808692.1 tetratricopeptide repeat protein [bacterium]
MIRQNRFAITSDITGLALPFAVALILLFPGLAHGEAAGMGTVLSETEVETPVRRDELPDEQLPGGVAVGKVLKRIQTELDSRQLTQASQNELEALATKYPNNYKVHLYYGLVLDDVGLPEQAMAEFELADKLGPQDPRGTAGIMNHILARGDTAAATELLQRALKRFPDSPEILFFMGKNFKEHRHWSEAQMVLSRAYKAGCKVKHLPVELGELYQESAPFLALKLANEDLAQYPDYYLSLQVKALALMNMGKFTAAIEPLKKLYHQSPTFNHSAEYYLRCLFWDGRYRDALNPGLYYLGKEAHAIGGPLVSSEVLGEIIGRLPANDVEQQLNHFYAELKKDKFLVRPAFHYYLANIFYKQGKAKLAKAELERLLESDPKSVEGFYLLGQLQENYGRNYEEALKAYEMAHALSPYDMAIEKAYNRLVERQAFRSSDWAKALRDWLDKLLGRTRLD